MDGFTQDELAAVCAYEEAFDWHYAAALADGCTHKEADRIAERRAHTEVYGDRPCSICDRMHGWDVSCWEVAQLW